MLIDSWITLYFYTLATSFLRIYDYINVLLDFVTHKRYIRNLSFLISKRNYGLCGQYQHFTCRKCDCLSFRTGMCIIIIFSSFSLIHLCIFLSITCLCEPLHVAGAGELQQRENRFAVCSQDHGEPHGSGLEPRVHFHGCVSNFSAANAYGPPPQEQ